MKRLGYTRYVAQGGDWGALIVDVMATQGHPELIGIHTNMPGVVPPEIDKALWAGSPVPAGLTTEEKLAYEMLAFMYKNVRYALYMATARKRCTRLTIHRLAWPPGCSTTTCAAGNDCAVL